MIVKIKMKKISILKNNRKNKAKVFGAEFFFQMAFIIK